MTYTFFRPKRCSCADYESLETAQMDPTHY